MSKSIRVLQAFVSMDGGGLTAYICQNYRWIDRDQVQFDFLTYDIESLPFENEFIALGAKVFHIHRPIHFLSFFHDFWVVLHSYQYDAIHFHLSYANFFPALVAKLCGAKRIIVHSHSTEIDDSRLFVRKVKTCVHRLGRLFWNVLADKRLACSKLAGEWMYQGSYRNHTRYSLMHNGIDVSRYVYNFQTRQRIRHELGILPDMLVVGHIGRFCYQKNQRFLLTVFADVYQSNPNSILVLIGTGEDKEDIHKLALELDLGDKVMFLGQRTDVPDLLQAMDVFVLPSRFEGLAIVGVEAQAAGMPCVVSDVVSEELALTDLISFLPLSASTKIWAQKIIDESWRKRENTGVNIVQAGYDIRQSVKELLKIYLQGTV